jgi:hypothetical protein
VLVHQQHGLNGTHVRTNGHLQWWWWGGGGVVGGGDGVRWGGSCRRK